MQFAEPSWLWIGLFSCLALIIAIAWSSRRRRAALTHFVAPQHAQALTSGLSPGRRALKCVLLVLGVACIFLAMARPRWGYHLESRQRAGADVVFAVDTSKSMLAEDLRPNRLTRAKLAVHDLVEMLPDARLGLVAFAGDAFLQTPLTFDRGALRETIDALDTEIIPVGGTSIESAIRVTQKALGSEPDRQKTLILLTDGEELSGSALAAAREAASKGLRIHTIGIGSAEGTTIPVRTQQGETELLRDANGELVRSRLDQATLSQIAQITGGSYQALRASGQGITELARGALAELPKQSSQTESVQVFHERFQLPLAAGVLLLFAEWLLGDRRRRFRRQQRSPALGGALALALVVTLPGVARADQAPGEVADSKAPAVAQYNQAAQAYRKGEFDRAVDGYRQALETRDLALQQRAYYDLGNSLYRLGERGAAADRKQAMERYRAAIRAYDAALALRKNDADASFNRDFVARRLAELEQEEQPGKQQDQQRPDQNQQGQNQQGQNQQGQNQQGQNQQGQNQQSQSPKGQQQQQGQNQQGQNQQGQNQQGQQQQGHQRQSQSQPQGQQPGKNQQGQPQGQNRQPGERDTHSPAGDEPSAKRDANERAQPGTAGPNQQPSAAREEARRADGERRTPGSMTRGEARALLEALEGDLRRLPSGFGNDSAQPEQNEAQRKDW